METKQKSWLCGILVLAIIVVVLLGGCGVTKKTSFKFSISTATIKDAKPCTSVDEGKNPVGITSTFTPESPEIYVWFSWAHTPKGKELKAVWIYEPSNLQIINYSTVLEDMAGQGSFALSRPTTEAGWPVGDYKVDLYFDDKIAKSVSFKVIGQVLPATEPTTGCEKITSSAGRDECYFTIALETKSLVLCEKIIEGIPKDMCYAVVTNDASICEGMTDGAGRDPCYATLARETKDSSLCERMTNDAEACHSVVAGLT